MLLRAGAKVELCHVTEKGQSAHAQKGKFAKMASTSKKTKVKGKKKAALGSDSDSEHIVESEDEAGTSPKGWKVDDDIKPQISKHDLPTFTIKTRLRSRSISLAAEPMGTDEEVDELEPTPRNSQLTIPPPSFRGTKRKSEEDVLFSSTPQIASLSGSRLLPEMISTAPSPKKKRIAQSSASSA